MKCKLFSFGLLAALMLVAASTPPAPLGQGENPNPPESPVKLVFIHHSTGENWLADGYGDLGRTLASNNYFVSDTNYGWGPEGVGDRTDIPDWMEWFRSSETPTYMQALFRESGQNSEYTRIFPDPGGENQIVMFKSCFPNSDLSGSPDDPPGTYAESSVAGAKYVYNELLRYFATRPDKLFVVITAPPLSDPTHAENARAFNQWLVHDWLRENDYSGSNVAVFDFYNVLTGPDGHHRYAGGRIEHTLAGGNTLYYPSGDDHPSAEGSRKATQEFVSLLNVYYHRWEAEAPDLPALEPDSAPETESESPESDAPLVSGSVIDDYERGDPEGTNGWSPYWDESTPTSMHCTADSARAHSGSNALLLDFEVTPGSWATCALFFEGQVQDWSAYLGISFHYQAVQPGLVFDVNIYSGDPQAQETYLYAVESVPESTGGWVPVELRWHDFQRADWEENAGAPLTNADRIAGMAFGFSTYEDSPNSGVVWVDDLELVGGDSESPQVVSEPTVDPMYPDGGRWEGAPFVPCPGTTMVPLVVVGVLWLGRLRR